MSCTVDGHSQKFLPTHKSKLGLTGVLLIDDLDDNSYVVFGYSIQYDDVQNCMRKLYIINIVLLTFPQDDHFLNVYCPEIFKAYVESRLAFVDKVVRLGVFQISNFKF